MPAYNSVMAKRSAGILLFRRNQSILEVFLGHPGGPFWRSKDLGAWTIPKGLVEPNEDMLEAAKREFKEETGFDLTSEPIPLQPVRQAGGKLVHAWAVEGDCDPMQLKSNLFEMEWPPRSGKKATFPEIDRAGWFDLAQAKTKIIPSQIGFVDQLADWIAKNKSDK